MFSKMTTLSDKKFIFIIDLSIIIFSVFLLRFPIALGYRSNVVYRGLGVIPIFVTLLFNISFVRKNNLKIKLDKKVLLLLGLFVAFWIQGSIRSALHFMSFDIFYFIENLFAFLTLGFFVAFAFFANPKPEHQTQLRKGLIYAFGLYITLNLVFYLLGIDSHDLIYLARYPTQMLDLLGIESYRVLFPMADGINSFGLLAGATLVGHFQLLKSQSGKLEKIIVFIVLLVCFLVILLTDSRGAFLFSILSIVLITLPRKVFTFVRWSPFLISALPVVVIIFAPNLLSATPSWLNRPKSEWTDTQGARSERSCPESIMITSGVLSNRPIIWEIVLDELKNFNLIHIVGYGLRGQVVSNISESYACLFASYSYNLLASSHNIWLQLILDIGYIGLIITLLLPVFLILKVTRLSFFVHNNYGYIALLNILLYIILIGSLEAPLSPDFYEIFILLIFVSISSLIVIPNS